MKLYFLHTGKTNQDFIAEGVEFYLKKLSNYTKIEWHELAAEKIKAGNRDTVIKEKEGELQLRYVKDDDYLILLDENGSLYNSRKFSSMLEKKLELRTKKIVFLTGGAYGFSDKVYKRANAKISLSPLTFSHQLVRLVLAEQIYRAYSIINNSPYHHD